FTFNAIDSGCGISVTMYKINSGDWQIYDGAFNLEGLEELEVSIEYFSTDRLGNDEEVQSVMVFINADNTPPETSISIGEPKYVDGENVYVTGVTEFTLTATDDISGVKKTEYKIVLKSASAQDIDNTAWITYTVPFTLNGYSDDEYLIIYRSIDNANNQEEEKSITVIVDNTKPVSGISIGIPKYISGNNKYVTSNTPFTITTVENGSGLNKIQYSTSADSQGDNSDWIEYNTAFTFSGFGEGQHTISYRGVDNLGNTEQVKTITVIVDDSSPETTIAYAPSREDNGTIYVIKGTGFTLATVDKPVLHSGVQRTEYMIRNSTGTTDTGWLNYLNPFNLAMYNYGEYIISYRSFDNLGTVEQEKSITVQLSEEFEGSIDLSTASSVLIWLNQKPEDVTSEKLERLTQILDESGLLMYNITTNQEDFVKGFRSSLYNTYVVLGNYKNLEGHTSLEMREHIFAGRGLISSKYYHFNGEGNKPEALGIVYHGSYPTMPIMVSLDDSPISTGGIFTAEELVYKAELNDTSNSVGYGTISVAPHDPTPAIVLNNYGKGKVVYLPFDLFLNLTEDNLSKLSELLKGSIEYVKPQEVQIIPGGIIPLQIRIKSLVVPLTVKVTEEVPGGVEIVQVFQDGDVDNNSITWQFAVSAPPSINSEKMLHFIVKLPDSADIYTFITTIDYLVSGLWYNYAQLTKDIELTGTSEDIKQAILEELNDLTPETHQDQNHINNVIKKIERLDLNSITTPEQKEHAILTLIQAIEILKKVESVEITNIKIGIIKLIILVEIMEV
ncbi:hypothetical protein KAU33_01730, partial [Candidatus Dependentiae bacterium]|nr:hypothetical protein [Candidatus Dependentiae bacterium]